MTIGNHPQSRGLVRLQSADPHVPPLVDPKYMAEKEDVDAMIEAVRWGKKLEKLGKGFSAV